MNGMPMTMDPTMDMPTTDSSGGGGMDMDMGMKMYFHTGYEKMVLFEKWVATTDGAMFGVCVFFFVLAVVYESLKYYRQVHSAKALSLLGGHVHEENGTAASSTTTQDSGPSAADKYERPLTTTRDRIVRPAIKRLSVAHLWQTFLHILQVFISYLLMLAVMTFNVWICLSIILGAGVGYFLVGSQKPNTYSAFEDHCH
ncbi:unnamed protein product [Oppiella nova]|uniref:Copper transport protein n=1 Tax=Oppiella nova TaxID=334625 RepID=A0A7R9MEK9_9ACAR|nr:unnamed protein product [Oppiella nova]CAG2174738.1 unnamed protein product [Oppiella nova]